MHKLFQDNTQQATKLVRKILKFTRNLGKGDFKLDKVWKFM
jgi:hypothetical protein